MSRDDYYWELNAEKDSIGPKRTLEFFLDAVKKGREHILALHNPSLIRNIELRRKAMKVVKAFKVGDRDLEIALAQIMANNISMPKTDKNHLVTIYTIDLFNRFLLNQDKDIAEKYHEYASFRASADYITITYGIRGKPTLPLSGPEAECFKKDFIKAKAPMKMDDFLRSGRLFYAHAADTAQRILDDDFFRLDDEEKRKLEKSVKINEKVSRNYTKCVEILRTVNYKLFKA